MSPSLILIRVMEQQGAVGVASGQHCVDPFVCLKKGKGTWPIKPLSQVLLILSPQVFWTMTAFSDNVLDRGGEQCWSEVADFDFHLHYI